MAEKSSHDLEYAHVPLSWIGPVRISGNVMNDEVKIPLATYAVSYTHLTLPTN